MERFRQQTKARFHAQHHHVTAWRSDYMLVMANVPSTTHHGSKGGEMAARARSATKSKTCSNVQGMKQIHDMVAERKKRWTWNTQIFSTPPCPTKTIKWQRVDSSGKAYILNKGQALRQTVLHTCFTHPAEI